MSSVLTIGIVCKKCILDQDSNRKETITHRNDD